MKAIYAASGEELAKIKSLGFDTVIGYFTTVELDQMSMLGLSCIICGAVKHPCIVAYMLLDEPDVNGISIAEQEARISEYRSFTDLPLCISMIEQLERKCSLNFDWYFMDVYYSNRMSKLKNFLDATFSPLFNQILYAGKRLMPIVGLYDDTGDFPFAPPDQDNFNRHFRSMFPTQDYATFFWSGDGVASNGIAQRLDYQCWATLYNTYGNQVCWYRKLLYPMAWLFLKINPYLGSHKISII